MLKSETLSNPKSLFKDEETEVQKGQEPERNLNQNRGHLVVPLLFSHLLLK